MQVVAGHNIAGESGGIEHIAELAGSAGGPRSVASTAVGSDCGTSQTSASRKVEANEASGAD